VTATQRHKFTKLVLERKGDWQRHQAALEAQKLVLNIFCLWSEPGFKVRGVKAHFLGGKYFCFHYMLETNFSGHSKICRSLPWMSPLLRVWSEPFSAQLHRVVQLSYETCPHLTPTTTMHQTQILESHLKTVEEQITKNSSTIHRCPGDVT